MQWLAILIQTVLLACCVAAAQPIDREIVDVSPNGQWVVQSTADGLRVVDLQNQQAAPLVPPKGNLPNREQALLRVTDSGDLYLIDSQRVTLYRQEMGEFEEFGQIEWDTPAELQSALVLPNTLDLYTQRYLPIDSKIKQEFKYFTVYDKIGFRVLFTRKDFVDQYVFDATGLQDKGIVRANSDTRLGATRSNVGTSVNVAPWPQSRKEACTPQVLSARDDAVCAILTCEDGLAEGLYLGEHLIAPQIDWQQAEIASNTKMVAAIHLLTDINGRETPVLQILWNGFVTQGVGLDLTAPRLRQVTHSEMYPMGLAVVTRDEIFSLSLIDAKPTLRKIY